MLQSSNRCQSLCAMVIQLVVFYLIYFHNYTYLLFISGLDTRLNWAHRMNLGVLSFPLWYLGELAEDWNGLFFKVWQSSSKNLSGSEKSFSYCFNFFNIHSLFNTQFCNTHSVSYTFLGTFPFYLLSKFIGKNVIGGIVPSSLSFCISLVVSLFHSEYYFCVFSHLFFNKISLFLFFRQPAFHFFYSLYCIFVFFFIDSCSYLYCCHLLLHFLTFEIGNRISF